MLRRDMKTFGKALVPLIAIPYFVSTFGIYWIVMDLALNVFGHRKEFNAWIKTTLTENCRVHEEIFKERVKDDEKKKKKKE